MKTSKVDKNQEENVLMNETLTEMRERIVRSFLDFIILTNLLKRGAPMGGYDVISFIHEEFDVMLSSGTIYSYLYSMERDGFIKGAFSRRKRIYFLTDKGTKKIKTVLEAKPLILESMAGLFI